MTPAAVLGSFIRPRARATSVEPRLLPEAEARLRSAALTTAQVDDIMAGIEGQRRGDGTLLAQVKA